MPKTKTLKDAVAELKLEYPDAIAKVIHGLLTKQEPREEKRAREDSLLEGWQVRLGRDGCVFPSHDRNGRDRSFLWAGHD